MPNQTKGLQHTAEEGFIWAELDIEYPGKIHPDLTDIVFIREKP